MSTQTTADVYKTFDSSALKRGNVPTPESPEEEVEQIREHLRQTEQDLREKDTSHLSAEQQERRERHLDRLREYWQEGEFPSNTDFSGERVPYFIDDEGVACAMGYLIQESGHEDLAREVAETNNHVYVEEIDDGPVLEWIEDNGFTKEEAARIQPIYCWWSWYC